MKGNAAESRLGALDGLRGVAALGVVFWHYQHFGGDHATYPYSKIFGIEWMYARGWLLVDFFFLLSGIVFTHKYLARVAGGTITGREFFILRLSRIYPLHLITLIVCASVQWSRMVEHKTPLIYQTNNDLYHFVLNLFFLQSGWFEEGFQYNNPSWSIAAEVFVYVLFFFIARRFVRGYVMASIVCALVGLTLYKAQWTMPALNQYMGRAMVGFFLGSLLFLGTRSLGERARMIVGIACVVALGGIAALVQPIGYDAFIGGSGFRSIAQHVLTLFPLTLVAALTLQPLARVLSLLPFTYLGDVSYSIYLLHVPLQLVILSVYESRHGHVPVGETSFFWTYLVILFGLATISHRFVELPAQNWLRRRFLARA